MGVVLDLSKYQGTIDFPKLGEAYKNGVIDGVILRVQHGYTIPDEKYVDYVNGCKQYGIPFGTYAYFAAISVNDAIAEAKSAIARTDKDSKFIAVDIEEASMGDLVAGGQAYIDYLKSNGIKFVGLYSYEGFYNAHSLGKIKSDFQWVAKYGVNDGKQHTPPNLPETDIWQFTSTGKIDGISTNVDESVITNHVEFPFFDRVKPSICYEAHIEMHGWLPCTKDGETAGTTGQGLRLEALVIRLDNIDAKLTVEGHVENYGWQSPRTNGEVIGTVGEGLRLEAIKIDCDKLNLNYRVHIQDQGWQDWVKNGEQAGTVGQSLRIEAIEIKIV